jgi:hypothetical protein
LQEKKTMTTNTLTMLQLDHNTLADDTIAAWAASASYTDAALLFGVLAMPRHHYADVLSPHRAPPSRDPEVEREGDALILRATLIVHRLGRCRQWSRDLLSAAADAAYYEARQLAARQPDLTDEQIERLSRDPQWIVRRDLASGRTLSPTIRDRLLADSDPYVRRAAQVTTVA